MGYLLMKLSHLKGLIILPTAGGVLADFWVPNEIDSLNFHHMLLSLFCEASQNLGLVKLSQSNFMTIYGGQIVIWFVVI